MALAFTWTWCLYGQIGYPNLCISEFSSHKYPVYITFKISKGTQAIRFVGSSSILEHIEKKIVMNISY